jgi:hypothetical protein
MKTARERITNKTNEKISALPGFEREELDGCIVTSFLDG